MNHLRSRLIGYQCVICLAESAYAPVCPACGAENTLRSASSSIDTRGRAPRRAERGAGGPQALRVQTTPIPRTSTGLGALDQALGGGFVPGSATLLSGERGVGKSTLALRLAAAIPKTLYIASEETREQVEYRMTRTELRAAGVPVLVTRDPEEILRWGREHDLWLVDSVHRLQMPTAASELLIDEVKASGKSLVCVAHLAKDGTVRGPSTMSYLYDVEIEISRIDETHRELVTLKNRWGPEGAWPLRLTAKGWTEETEEEDP